MTQPNDPSHRPSTERGSHSAGPVTVTSAKEPSKKGCGGIVAMLTIPGLVLLVLIVGYFVLSALKSNTEREGGLPGETEKTRSLPE
jgi:hypothetical protein